PTLRPSAASDRAILTAVVDLPTPPFPEPMARMRRTPLTLVLPAGWGEPWENLGPVGFSEVMETMTLRGPAKPCAAAMAASRAGPKAASMPGATAMAKAMALGVAIISERPEKLARSLPPGISTRESAAL